MLVRVDNLDPAGRQLELSRDQEWLAALQAGDDDLQATSGLAASVCLQRSGRDIRLRGRLHADLEGRCGRCLATVPLHLESEFTLLLLPEGPDTQEAKQSAELAEVVWYRPDQPQVDLGPLLREQILLALPRYPLCDPDCLGLCPRCGGNRNIDPCDCQEERPDPRWGPLAELSRGG